MTSAALNAVLWCDEGGHSWPDCHHCSCHQGHCCSAAAAADAAPPAAAAVPAAAAATLATHQANRAHTYLGKRESEWHVTGDEADIYPDFVTMAKSFGVPAQRVISKVGAA